MCHSSNSAPHTWFSTEFKGGSKAVKARIYNLLAPARTRRGLAALILVLFAVALAGGLVALRFFSLSGAYIDMDLQYYNTFGAYLEVPILRGDDNEAVRTINAELAALKSKYIRYMDDPYGAGAPVSLLAYPSTTERYLNVIVVAPPEDYGSDGNAHAWVYDRKERTQLTTAQALDMAGITEESLRGGLTALNENDPGHPRTVSEVKLEAFRIRPDGKPEFFLYVFVESTNELDSWGRLFRWSDGAFTRLSSYWHLPLDQPYEPIIPADQVDKTAKPLYLLWGPGGGQPEGGFTVPTLDPQSPEFDAALQTIILPMVSPISDHPSWYYSIGDSRVEQLGNTPMRARRVFIMDQNDSGSIVSYLGDFFEEPYSSVYYFSRGGNAVLEPINVFGNDAILAEAPALPGFFYGDGPLYSDALRHLKSTMVDPGGEAQWSSVGPIVLDTTWTVRGYDTGVYHCPSTPIRSSDWSDPSPYLVFVRYGGFYYVGALSEEDRQQPQAVEALVTAWAERFAAMTALPLATGNDTYEVNRDSSSVYTNAQYGFTISVPKEWGGWVSFRASPDGADVYCTDAFQYWVAQHDGDEGSASTSSDAGLLCRVRMENGVPTVVIPTDYAPTDAYSGEYMNLQQAIHNGQFPITA